ncbi:MAG: ClbS/DfsB family four-helix bundle protein [Anaerolineales bacterium]|nr:ClbS/DfsB family four-helix bundle protein [Anaerolineales bacterium]
MTDETTPQTKAELLARIAEGRTALEQALGRLSEAQLTTPAASGWAIKDHLAHLSAWEAGIAALLQHQPRWAAMGLDEAAITQYEMDDWNEILYQQNRERSLAEVRHYFAESHRQLVAAVESLSEEDLFKPYAYFEVGEAGKDDTRPIIGRIIGNTYEHYEEHQEWIEAALRDISEND